VKSALDAADKVRNATDKGAAAAAGQLEAAANDLGRDAASATGRDAARLKALAETMKGCAAKLRG
jgi:hypothetical protein